MWTSNDLGKQRQIGQATTLASQESTHLMWNTWPQAESFLHHWASLKASRQTTQSSFPPGTTLLLWRWGWLRFNQMQGRALRIVGERPVEGVMVAREKEEPRRWWWWERERWRSKAGDLKEWSIEDLGFFGVCWGSVANLWFFLFITIYFWVCVFGSGFVFLFKTNRS